MSSPVIWWFVRSDLQIVLLDRLSYISCNATFSSAGLGFSLFNSRACLIHIYRVQSWTLFQPRILISEYQAVFDKLVLHHVSLVLVAVNGSSVMLIVLFVGEPVKTVFLHNFSKV